MFVIRLALAALCANAAAGTYHLSPAGDDGNDGTAPYRAWKTLDRLNRQHLQPGDTVLLEGGARFEGPLLLDARDAGAPGKPVTIATESGAPAVISVIAGDGFRAVDTPHIHLRNLVFEGPGRTNSAGGHGLLFETADPDGGRIPGVRLQGVEATGFYWNGLSFLSGHASNPGFDGTAVADCRFSGNGLNGIEFGGRFQAGGEPRYAHRGIVIRDTFVSGNSGRPGLAAPSGCGISLGFTDGAEVIHCQAYGNGALSDAVSGGPAAFRIWQSRRVTVRRCEAGTTGTNGRRGAGFALDGGAAECLFEYNFAHGNAGSGFVVTQFPFAHPARDNIVRYNIAQSNGRAAGAGIFIEAAHGNAGIFGTVIAHNAVYAGAPQNGPAFAYSAAEDAAPAQRTAVVNNIFITAAGKTAAAVAAGASGWRFEANVFHTLGHAPRFEWEGAAFEGLDAWRAAAAGLGTLGWSADPMLRAPGSAPGLESPRQLPALTAYLPSAESPVIDRAAAMAYPGLHAAPPEDFGGRPSIAGAAPDIGPFEYHPPAAEGCFAETFGRFGFETFALVLGGQPPGALFFYPGYYDYPTGKPGDPALQDGDGNGIRDVFDLALLAGALCQDERIRAHYEAALAFHEAIWRVEGVDYSFGAVYGIAAFDVMSRGGGAIVEWTSGSRYGPYRGDRTDDEPLSAAGDFDGDGLSNVEEFRRVVEAGGGPEAYARAATGR